MIKQERLRELFAYNKAAVKHYGTEFAHLNEVVPEWMR